MNPDNSSLDVLNEKSGPHWLNEALALDLLNGQVPNSEDLVDTDLLDRPLDLDFPKS